MGATENLKYLTKCINEFGEKTRVAANAIATLGESFASYIENDVKATHWLYIDTLPNNKRKMMGLPMRRSKALRKIKKKKR